MKKKLMLEIAPNNEYSNIFISNGMCFFQRRTDFGIIIEGKMSIIKSFDYRYELFFLANRLFYLEDYEKEIGYLYDTLISNFLKIIDFNSFEVRRASSNVILYTNRRFPQSTLFDIEENKIIWIQNRFVFFTIFNNKLLIHKEKSKVVRYDFSTGIPLWQYDLPSDFDWESQTYIDQINHHKADIQRLIGIYEGVLWVSLNSGRLLGLNVENGNLLYNISRINHYDGEKAIFSQYYPNDTILNPDWGLYFGKYLQLDESKGILFGLRNQYYYEIDLKNPNENYFLYDISESCKQWQIEADVAGYEWNWDGDEIFFGQNFSDGNNLGTFDRSKKEIVWATRIEKPNGQVHNFSKIDYATGRLYALDQTGTLHIFERE